MFLNHTVENSLAVVGGQDSVLTVQGVGSTLDWGLGSHKLGSQKVKMTNTLETQDITLGKPSEVITSTITNSN